jgi:hypothetical protein
MAGSSKVLLSLEMVEFLCNNIHNTVQKNQTENALKCYKELDNQKVQTATQAYNKRLFK